MLINVNPKSSSSDNAKTTYGLKSVNLSINFDQHWLTFKVNQPIKID